MTHSYVDRRGFTRNRTYSIATMNPSPNHYSAQMIEPKIQVIQPRQIKVPTELKQWLDECKAHKDDALISAKQLMKEALDVV